MSDEESMRLARDFVARYEVLCDIARQVATKDTVSEHAFGGYDYCIFCEGHEYRMLPFKHEASCIVLKARALVAQNSQQSQ